MNIFRVNIQKIKTRNICHKKAALFIVKIDQVKLRGLSAVLLGFRISKGVKNSNWANDELAPQQIHYAATDAWVGRKLYLALEQYMDQDAP